MSEEKKFIMSPKVDFAFKLIFGDERKKNTLISFLSAVLDMPIDRFEEIQFINTEMEREFVEDKKGILDVLVKLKDGSRINVEIQVASQEHLPQRTLFYWSKMYTKQASKGNSYTVLKKCITINVLDFICTPEERAHTTYLMREKTSGNTLDNLSVIEIHFLEMPKIEEDHYTNPTILEWLKFIRSKDKEEMEMLVNKNPYMQEAYDTLVEASQNPETRSAYEAREKELMDQRTREYEQYQKGKTIGREEGKEEGKEETKREFIQTMLLKQLDLNQIAEIAKISIEEINEMKRELENKHD